MTNEYDIGDSVRLQGTFTDVDGAAFDPDTVTVKYQDPSGNDTSSTSATQSATGVYYLDIEVDEGGIWYYRFEGTATGGAKQGAEETYFWVSTSQF